MKKLTLVLVALLLALACVFAACGKKNDTPTDTNPKPVDDNPAVVNPTVAKEDLVKIAETLNESFAKNYVDLYSAEVKEAIDTEKSNVLAQIYAASTKEEAQEIADKFIAFLKAQKTTVDELKDLIEKIGEVSLADEDAIKQAADYVDTLNNKAYAGNNAAKKAILDAFKADKTTKETVEKMSQRLAELSAIKEAADDEKTGVNGKTIADLKKTFTGKDYTFDLTSYDAYEAVVAAIEKAAENTALLKIGDKENVKPQTGAIAADSEAYAEIFDVATLAEMKALLDAAIAAKPVLSDLKAIIDAAEALKAAAEEARWKEYVYVNGKDLKDAKNTEEGYIYKVGAPDSIKYAKATYATEAAAKEAKAENITKIEDASIDLNYKLALKADIEAAEDLVKALNKKYTATEKTKAGYEKDNDGAADLAFKAIEKVRADYNASVEKAKALYAEYLGAKTTFVTADPKKDATIASYAAFTTSAKNYNVGTEVEIDEVKYKGTKLGDEIAAVVKTFKTVNASGYKVSYKDGYINEGNYTLNGYADKAVNPYSFNLVTREGGDVAAIDYTAWTYSYEFDGKTAVVSKDYAKLTAAEKEKAISVDVFDVLAELGNYKKAEAALKWLVIFIGEGDYAEKYDLEKDYGFAEGTVLYMTDRDVKEVAKAGVVEINGKATDVAADAATEIKMLSSYTVAKAVVETTKQIKDAQDAAVEELKAAVLALRKAGDANAIADARALYDAIEGGSYVNKKLNGDAADAEKNGSYAFDPKDIKVVVKEATAADKDDAKEVNLKAMLVAAEGVRDEALKFVDFSSITAAADALNNEKTGAKAAFAKNEAMVAAFAKIVEKAAAEVARCQAAYDLTTTNDNRIVNAGALAAAKDAQAKVDALADLLLVKAAFDAANESNTILNVKGEAKAADVWDLIKAYTDSSDKAYGALASGTDEEKALSALCAYIFAIYNGDGDDQAALKAKVDDAEKNLVKAFTDFKHDYTVKAQKGTAAFFNKFTKEADGFATLYNADYLNLTVSYTYGDNTITVDLFTEAYRQTALAKVFGKIAKIDAAAESLADKKVLGSDWTALVTANVNETEVKFDALTSIEEAVKFVEAYELTDATYKLDNVLELVNAERVKNSKTAITLEKLKDMIADK